MCFFVMHYLSNFCLLFSPFLDTVSSLPNKSGQRVETAKCSHKNCHKRTELAKAIKNLKIIQLNSLNLSLLEKSWQPCLFSLSIRGSRYLLQYLPIKKKKCQFAKKKWAWELIDIRIRLVVEPIFIVLMNGIIVFDQVFLRYSNTLFLGCLWQCSSTIFVS